MLESHELASEFPEFKDKIHNLKVTDAHFARIFDEYHNVTKEVERLEGVGQPTSDSYAETLKKKRLSLKDDLFHMLKNAA